MKFKAALFDMDGLLIDSEYYWDEYGSKFFISRGIPFTQELRISLTGRSMIENARWIKQHYNLPESEEEIYAERKRDTDKIYDEVSNPMTGAEDLVRSLREEGIKQAIVSGANLERINKIIKRFHWEQYFDTLVAPEHVNYISKPAPDIYLCAAERLGVKPSDCVAFEDSENGVISVKEAGMTCVAVPDKRWSFGDLSRADIHVDSLGSKDLWKALEIPLREIGLRKR